MRPRWQKQVAVVLFSFLCAASAGASFYRQVNLVSDLSGYPNQDLNLVNPWGLAFSPTGNAWTVNAGTGTATSYTGSGIPQSTVVTMPGGAGASPTGIVYNGTSGFVVTNGAYSGASQYIFAGEGGTILGWSPKVPPPAPSKTAQLAVDNSSTGAVYKGLALGASGGSQFLYAADFHNNKISVFDSGFHAVTMPGGFVDPAIPAGYAPFNVENINGLLYVAYAMQDVAKFDDVRGAGHGYVDVFDTNGNLLHHLIGGGVLNSPWGMAVAPANFGLFSGDLLVGNFGNGQINAFDPNTGAWIGALLNKNGSPLQINGLWAIKFGNGYHGQGTNQLFFTAGIKNETHGLYGKITAVTTTSALAAAAIAVPEPSGLVLGAIAACGIAGALVSRRHGRRRARLTTSQKQAAAGDDRGLTRM